MMNDLFEREQRVLDEAAAYLEQLPAGVPCEPERYALLVKEYGKLLKQLRRITKISDRTTVNLNTKKLDLQDKVVYDAMTGIHNRRYLDEQLEKLPAELGPGGRLSVLMMDVDFFKLYNDTYGHSMGDDCLRSVAEALQDTVEGTGGLVARYGGEEFIALLPHMEAGAACELAIKALQNVRARRIPHEKNAAGKYVTISIGVSSGLVGPSHPISQFVKQADQALYRSKQTGRDRHTFFTFEEGAENP